MENSTDSKKPWPYYRPVVLWAIAAAAVALVVGLVTGRPVWLALLLSLGTGVVAALWWFRLLTLDERVHTPRRVDPPS